MSRVYSYPRKKTTARRKTAAQKIIYVQAPAPARRVAVRKPRIPAKPKPESNSMGADVGASLGAMIGHGAQKLAQYITGFGDYKVSGNTLMNLGINPPEIVNKSNREVCIRHREFLGDVNGTSAFTVTSYPINPGLSSSFPWLSTVAQAFEQYRFDGLIFEFKSMSADYTTNTALGSVVMATQYNAIDANFPDKKTMENYEFANSDKLSNTFIHPVECKRSLTPVSELYTRIGGVPAGADARLYDLGNFQIATVGNPVTSVIGELWCTYEVCLLKPQALGPDGLNADADHWIVSTGCDATHPFGTAPVLSANSTLGTTIVLGNGFTSPVLSFPSSVSTGRYLVMYEVIGTAAAITNQVNSIGNANIHGAWGSAATIPNGTTTPTLVNAFYLTITGTPATWAPGTLGVFPTAITQGDIWITQVPENVS